MIEDKNISILSNCTSGGCGAKIGAGELSSLLKNIPTFHDDNLIVGFDSSDDAAVYKMNEHESIISTVDFFSPMVDDAKTFGKIAAANALSDVYAMGGTPILALNLVCFPEKYPKQMLADILAGGAEIVAESGAVIAGGHSIYDKEPKYGLCVTGKVDNDKIIRNNTPMIGNDLILTKPLGVGIVMASKRIDMCTQSALEKAIYSMQRLNKYAAEKMSAYNISACTDITGFGLLAHLLEMCDNKVSAEIDINNLPIIDEAIEYASNYIFTAAGQRNRNYFNKNNNISKQLDKINPALQEILFDPQTSGGLLICVDSSQSESLLNDIQKDDPNARIIGKITEKQKENILFS